MPGVTHHPDANRLDEKDSSSNLQEHGVFVGMSLRAHPQRLAEGTEAATEALSMNERSR